MAWFLVAVASFFLYAVAAVTDKFMLDKTPVVPVSYAFYICLMGAAVSGAAALFLFVLEGRFLLPHGLPLAAVAVSGAAQFFGLLFMFSALRRGEVSKTNPVIVSLQPVFSLALSLALPALLRLLGRPSPLEPVALRRLPGIALVVAGSYLLSQTGTKRSRFGPGVWLNVLPAALFQALSLVAADVTYTAFEESYLPAGAGAGERNLMFVKALLWGRWFALAGALLFVAATGNFRALRRGQPAAAVPAQTAGRGGWVVAAVFLFGQVCGALAVILNQYAVKLGNVVTVSALGGLQFFFVIAISAVLTRFLPRLLSESSTRRDLLFKVLWSCVLFGGVALLVL